MSYTIGVVAIESSALPQTAAEREPGLEERLRGVRLFFEFAPRSTFPNVVDSAPQLARFGGGAHFADGLDRILSSVSLR